LSKYLCHKLCGVFFPQLDGCKYCPGADTGTKPNPAQKSEGRRARVPPQAGAFVPVAAARGDPDVPGRGLEGEASPGAPRLRCGQNLKGNKSALSSGPNVDECRWSPWPELLEAGWLVLKQRATSSRPPVTPGWSAGLQTTLSSAWPAEQ